MDKSLICADKLREVLPREQTEAFNENMLSSDQFSLLIENFLGEGCEDKLLYSFISYISTYYLEGEEDKLYRINKVGAGATRTQIPRDRLN